MYPFILNTTQIYKTFNCKPNGLRNLLKIIQTSSAKG